jgi:hypothetical protein
MAMAGDASRRLAAVNVSHGLVLIGLTLPCILLLGPMAAGLAYVLANVLRLVAGFAISITVFGGALRPALLTAAMLKPVSTGLLFGWGLWLLSLPLPQNWPLLGLAYAAVVFAVVAGGCLVTAASAEGRGLLRHAWAYSWRKSPDYKN